MGKLTEIISLPELQAIRNGDHDTFIDVYNTLHAKTFRFFLKRVLLHDIAKDLTQQCFIRLWQFRHTLSDDHPFEKQLFIIARSLLINHIRTETTRKKINLRPGGSMEQSAAQPASALHFEVCDEVSVAIGTLPPVRKKIMMLKAFYGWTNKEIALQMSISVKTVEDHVSKAFRHIRQVVVVLLVLLGLPF